MPRLAQRFEICTVAQYAMAVAPRLGQPFPTFALGVDVGIRHPHD